MFLIKDESYIESYIILYDHIIRESYKVLQSRSHVSVFHFRVIANSCRTHKLAGRTCSPFRASAIAWGPFIGLWPSAMAAMAHPISALNLLEIQKSSLKLFFASHSTADAATWIELNLFWIHKCMCPRRWRGFGRARPHFCDLCGACRQCRHSEILKELIESDVTMWTCPLALVFWSRHVKTEEISDQGSQTTSKELLHRNENTTKTKKRMKRSKQLPTIKSNQSKKNRFSP